MTVHTGARLGEQQLSFDRLAWLLACMALVLAPHVLRLPWWITGLFVVLALWRLGAARMRWGMAPAWLRGTLAVAGVVAIGIQFRAWGGQEAGIAMLVVMLSLKLTETVRKRDGIVLIMIGYILVIGNFLYSQTLPTGAYMMLMVWLITATLLHLNHPVAGFPPPERLRQAGLLLLQALPVAAVLFLLFPRVPGPLWGVPAGQQAVSGLTDRMEPGAIAELGRSNAVAFRVAFDDEMPGHHQLYWRGPVLQLFDGRVWLQGTEPQVRDLTYFPRGEPVPYEVTLEPHRYRWLFALDLPAEIPPNAAVTRTFQLIADRPVRERRRYRTMSYPDYVTGRDPNPYQVQRALQLPQGGNPRARRMARELAAAHGEPRELIGTVLQRFRDEPYHYTLSPPTLGEHSVDEFLFETLRGFCEHYAGSFAFLMRAAGIPARVVLGYHGGEYNPIGDYIIVRQSDAHAWVEVHLDDEGWVRVDPTAAVSPQRIELGLNAIEGLEGRAGDALRNMPVFARMWLRWDDFNNRWNLFVLGYDREQQRALVARFGFADADYRTLVVLLTVLVGGIMAALAFWLLWQVRPRRTRDPAVRLYLKLQHVLERRGILPRRRDEGPVDFARRAAAADRTVAEPLDRFIRAYVRRRYERAPAPSDLDDMREALRQIQ